MTNEVTTTKDSAELPLYLKDHGYKNEDNFDSSDIILPRIKLLQGTSEEITQFDNAKIGNFWHTGADLDLGPAMKFQVADRNKKALLMAPMSDGQGILARSGDLKTWDRTGKWTVRFKGRKEPVEWEIKTKNVAESGLMSWGTQFPGEEDSPPAATLFYDYLVFLMDYLDLGPAIISIARTGLKNAKKGLNDKIAFHGNHGRPMQALVFEARSIDDTADGQDFKNWSFRQAGFVQDAGQFELAREHMGALGRFKVADESDTGAPKDDTEGADEVPF
jgi:hypothetical protein